jgi:hypothetical protein
MGDDTSGSASVADLANQVNRFGAAAPTGYQFVTTPFDVPPAPFGIQLLPLNLGLATMALTIYQRRASDAYSQFHDQGSLNAINQANAGFADPVAFVTKNLSVVVSTLRAFADALGIPPVGGETSTFDTGISTGSLILAALAAAWWLL